MIFSLHSKSWVQNKLSEWSDCHWWREKSDRVRDSGVCIVLLDIKRWNFGFSFGLRLSTRSIIRPTRKLGCWPSADHCQTLGEPNDYDRLEWVAVVSAIRWTTSSYKNNMLWSMAHEWNQLARQPNVIFSLIIFPTPLTQYPKRLSASM